MIHRDSSWFIVIHSVVLAFYKVVLLVVKLPFGLNVYFFQQIIRAKKIIAFEPIPHLFKRLNFLFPSIEVYPYAVSDQSAKSKLYIPFIASKKYETRAKLDILPENGETRVDKIQVETITGVILAGSINAQTIPAIKEIVMTMAIK